MVGQKESKKKKAVGFDLSFMESLAPLNGKEGFFSLRILVPEAAIAAVPIAIHHHHYRILGAGSRECSKNEEKGEAKAKEFNNW